MKIYNTIIQSYLTEKSSREQEKGKYVFLVKKTASKTDVKHAIKAIYGAEVENVKTMIIPKKVRVVGKHELIKRPVTKKAIVTLKEGEKIDPNKIKETLTTKSRSTKK